MAGTPRRTLSQTDLQNGELGPGWPSTYEQYSAEARAGPGEEPRQVHKRLRASDAGSVASRTSVATRGPFRSQPFMGRPLLGRKESMRLFLSLTVFYQPRPLLPSTPCPSRVISSVLAAVFSLSSRQQGRSPAGPFAKPGGETGHRPDCFEPGPSEGSAGYLESVTGLDMRVTPREDSELPHPS